MGATGRNGLDCAAGIDRNGWPKSLEYAIGAELQFEVVSRAYERLSLIVTTNLPFEAWTEVMGSERLTGALLDRLTHRVHILEANGESFRLREAKTRQKRSRVTPDKPS